MRLTTDIDSRGTVVSWLRVGMTFLALSLVATLLLPNGVTVDGNRTILLLDTWVQRTCFWLGLIFVAGYVLGRIFSPDRNL